MKTALSVTCLLALAALGSAVPMQRIVGGEATEDGDFPEMVSVYLDPLLGGKEHLCGGIIVNDNHVLTTASCMEDQSTLFMYVMGAGTNLDEPAGYEEVKGVEKVFVHELYDPVNKANDLAILRTSTNFVFVSDLVTPAVLPPTGTPEPATGTLFSVVGWGQTSLEGDMQVQQRAVNMTYLSNAECQEVFGELVVLNDGCLQGEGVGVCSGDEGGIVKGSDGLATAMVSWHLGCEEYPAVVTLLAPYHDWIISHFES